MNRVTKEMQRPDWTIEEVEIVIVNSLPVDQFYPMKGKKVESKETATPIFNTGNK